MISQQWRIVLTDEPNECECDVNVPTTPTIEHHAQLGPSKQFNCDTVQHSNNIDCGYFYDQSNHRLHLPVCLTSLAPLLPQSPPSPASTLPTSLLYVKHSHLEPQLHCLHHHHHHGYHHRHKCPHHHHHHYHQHYGYGKTTLHPLYRQMAPDTPLRPSLDSLPLSPSHCLTSAIASLIPFTSHRQLILHESNYVLGPITTPTTINLFPHITSLVLLLSTVVLVALLCLRTMCQVAVISKPCKTVRTVHLHRSTSTTPLYHIAFILLVLFSGSSIATGPCTTGDCGLFRPSIHSVVSSSNTHSIGLRAVQKRSEGFSNLHQHHNQHYSLYRSHQVPQTVTSYSQSYPMLMAHVPHNDQSVLGNVHVSSHDSSTRRTHSDFIAHSLSYPTSNSRQSIFSSGITHLFEPSTSSHYPRNSYNQYSHHSQLKSCPKGPSHHQDNQMDAATKAYLAPVVFYGQLISLAEDYGGRISAKFRLLKLIKPNVHHGTSSTGNVSFANFISNREFETHITLYFVKNLENLEAPYCALHMPDISEKLRTQQKYILFAHNVINRNFTVPASSPSTRSIPSSHHTNLVRHHQTSSHSKHSRHIGHQMISLVTFATPELLNRNTSRLVRKVICKGCASPARVHSNVTSVRVNTRANVTLACRVDGNPIPKIEWYRNGKRLRTRKKIVIKNRRRISHLTILHASLKRNNTTFECRAKNVVSKMYSTRRIRVYVTVPSNVKSKYHHKIASKNVTDALNNSASIKKPCPVPKYCLNGSTCSYYEEIGEYVCFCPPDFRGQRCEFKNVNEHPQKASLDYNLETETSNKTT